MFGEWKNAKVLFLKASLETSIASTKSIMLRTPPLLREEDSSNGTVALEGESSSPNFDPSALSSLLIEGFRVTRGFSIHSKSFQNKIFQLNIVLFQNFPIHSRIDIRVADQGGVVADLDRTKNEGRFGSLKFTNLVSSLTRLRGKSHLTSISNNEAAVFPSFGETSSIGQRLRYFLVCTYLVIGPFLQILLVCSKIFNHVAGVFLCCVQPIRVRDQRACERLRKICEVTINDRLTSILMLR